jgi:hypothetical protein
VLAEYVHEELRGLMEETFVVGGGGDDVHTRITGG